MFKWILSRDEGSGVWEALKTIDERLDDCAGKTSVLEPKSAK
jgi:hypothetical protein